jgi:hypothetical protein
MDYLIMLYGLILFLLYIGGLTFMIEILLGNSIKKALFESKGIIYIVSFSIVFSIIFLILAVIK